MEKLAVKTTLTNGFRLGSVEELETIPGRHKAKDTATSIAWRRGAEKGSVRRGNTTENSERRRWAFKPVEIVQNFARTVLPLPWFRERDTGCLKMCFIQEMPLKGCKCDSYLKKPYPFSM